MHKIPGEPMPQPAENSLQETAILTRSIEFVVRNFVKILIGKISLVRLQQLVQSLYIEEAENYLKRERPDKAASLTALIPMITRSTSSISMVAGAPARATTSAMRRSR